MISASRTVRIEFVRLDAVSNQIFSCRAVDRNRACRRNVIGGHAIAKNRQDSRPMHVGQRRRLLWHVVEIRRHLDVRGFGIPLINVARGHRHGFPVCVAFKNLCVLLAVHFGSDRLANGFFYFLRSWPDVSEINGFAFTVGAQRFRGQIHIHSSGQRIRDHQEAAMPGNLRAPADECVLRNCDFR